MKFKKALLVALGLFATGVIASTYQTQVDLDYIDIEDTADSIGLTGTWHVEPVETENTAWAEAAFMGRKSNFSVNYATASFEASNADDIASYGLGFEYLGNNGTNLYAEFRYGDTDVNGQDSVISGAIGYFFARDWLIKLSTSDQTDAPVILTSKYIADLGQQFLNLELVTDDEENDLTAIGDFYWSPQSSAGLELSTAEGFNYGIRLQHFFMPNVAAKLVYQSYDADFNGFITLNGFDIPLGGGSADFDIINLSLIGRF